MALIQERLRVESLLLHIERSQLRRLRHLARMAPALLSDGPLGGDPQGHARMDYVSLLAYECIGKVWVPRFKVLPPQPDPRLMGRGWMDGWIMS